MSNPGNPVSEGQPAGLPAGIVTFLFTDIEGSTRLWEAHPDRMGAALARHDALLRTVAASHHGHVFKTVGDAFCVAFTSAAAALAAALDAQRALQHESWDETPIRVRMGLHTGEVETRAGDYFGRPLNRVARLMSAGHGGQVLLSAATAMLVKDALPPGTLLKDMGPHRLRDLGRPEEIYQLQAEGLPADFPPLRTLELTPHNLPARLTSFIGREQEIEAIRAALRRTRLVTLSGWGGVGKTRLALEVAGGLLSDFPDGVWFVDLASISDPARVVDAVIGALGLQIQAAQVADHALAQFLQDRQALIILDNCEHVIETTVALTGEILLAARTAKVLATSRESLGIPGETVLTISPLAQPDLQSDVAQVMRYESVQLFVERARAVLPEFAITAENAPSVARIARQLDGIPLAIELAAARVRMLTIEQIAERLARSYNILSSSERTLDPRQRTLRAMIDCSYELLPADEQRLLNRLSVFRGGWTLEAAEAVAAPAGTDLLDPLANLIAKSFVTLERHPGQEARYGMLETICRYAAEKLDAADEAQAVAGRHLAYYVALAETADSEIHGPAQGAWLQRLEDERHNLRVALTNSLAGDRPPDAGLSLGSHSYWYWFRRGHIDEGRDWLGRLLERTAGDPMSQARATVLGADGLLAALQGDLAHARSQVRASRDFFLADGDPQGIVLAGLFFGIVEFFGGGDAAEARLHLERSLAVARELGLAWQVGESLHILGHVAKMEDDSLRAQQYFEESVAQLRAIGDTLSMAHPVNDLGRTAVMMGDLESARRLFEESRAIFKGLGSAWGEAMALQDLGEVSLLLGDARGAESTILDSLLLAREVGDRMRMMGCLIQLGGTAVANDEGARAARLLGAIAALGESGADLPQPESQEWFERQVAAAEALAGADAFAAAWAAGRAMSLAETAAYALGETDP